MKNIIKKFNTYFNTVLMLYILILMNFSWGMPLYVAGIFLLFTEIIFLIKNSIQYSEGIIE